MLSLTLLSNHSTFYQVLAAVLAKIYSNLMLVLLNSGIWLGKVTYESCEGHVRFQIHLSDRPVHAVGTDNYELGGNELVAEERIIFMDVNDANNSVHETVFVFLGRWAYWRFGLALLLGRWDSKIGVFSLRINTFKVEDEWHLWVAEMPLIKFNFREIPNSLISLLTFYWPRMLTSWQKEHWKPSKWYG